MKYYVCMIHCTNSFSLSSIEDSVILAVNQEYITPDQTVQLKPGVEVAVIPPISGGWDIYSRWARMGSDADLVRITAERLSQKEVTEFVTDSSSGAISIFIGKQISKYLLFEGEGGKGCMHKNCSKASC